MYRLVYWHDFRNVLLCFVIVSFCLSQRKEMMVFDWSLTSLTHHSCVSVSVVCSVPPCLGPGCSRLPQRPLAALQKEEPGAGGGRADLPVLVSTTLSSYWPSLASHINLRFTSEWHVKTRPRPLFWGKTKATRRLPVWCVFGFSFTWEHLNTHSV